MTYRTLHSVYIASAAMFWAVVLGIGADRSGVLAALGLQETWNGIGILAAFMLAFSAPTVGVVIAAIIAWRFRRDRTAVVPAALYLAAGLFFLATVVASTRMDLTDYQRMEPILMGVLTALLILFGLSATWVACSWFRKGCPADASSSPHPGVPPF